MIILGIGSNLSSKHGDRFKNLELVVKYLEKHGIKVIKKSSYYETPSYPNKNNPKFINAVIGIENQKNPEKLASIIIKIEGDLGRKRLVKNEPRTCDIDIIDYEGKIIDFKYLNFNFSVPHKEIKKRNFVLFPLKEIFPEWKHPITKEPVETLVEKLSLEEKNSILKIKKN